MSEDMSKEEQIGFHKGSISVLTKEREELLKIVNITEQLIQMHAKQLDEHGVKMDQPKEEPKVQKKVPIENLI